MRAAPVLALSILLLLLPSIAAAKLGPPIKVRLVDGPVRARTGSILTAQIEIQAAAPVTIANVEVEGEGWSVLDVDALPSSNIAKGGSHTFTVRAIPLDPDERLQIHFFVDDVPLTHSLDFSEWAYAKATGAGETRKLSETTPARESFPHADEPKPQPADPPAVPQEHMEKEDDAGVPKAPRDIRVHGRFVYERENPNTTFTTVGADGLTFRIYDDDFVGRQLLATGVTDPAGFFDTTFEWNQCCEADPDLVIEFEAENAVVEVEEPILEFNYVWATGEWHNFAGTDLDAGVISPLLEEDHPALHILTNITRTWRWLFVNEGYDTPPVDVQWPASGFGAWYSSFYKEIHISSDSQWKESTLAHEYGHHWTNLFATAISPSYCNGICDTFGCGHCKWCEEDGAIAWSEGFADWMGSFVPLTFAADYGLTPNYWIALEFVTRCLQVTPNVFHDPTITEGFLGAVLLDIMDSTQEDDPFSPGIFDELQLGTDEIFAVAELDDPSDPVDFLLSFLARYPSVASELWSTAKNNGYELDTQAPPAPTNLYSTTHLINVPNGDATPQFLWDIPVDDVSGVVGFSVLVSGVPGMPDATQDIGGQNFYDAAPLAPGTYFFNLRTVDRAGNWGTGYATYGPFIVDLPDPADLQFVLAGGWDHPLVPRGSPDATPGNVHVSPTLPGAGATYWNVPYVNSGDEATASGFDIGLKVDGLLVDAAAVPSAPSGGSQYLFNAGSISVVGGRHTLSAFLDSSDVIAEQNESNNEWGHQWSWTPLVLVESDLPMSISAPPVKTAGWSTVTDGSPLFYNSHGYEAFPTTEWNAISIHATKGTGDYDMRLHAFDTSVNGFAAPLLESARTAGKIDAIVLNRNQTAPKQEHVGVINANRGSGSYFIDWVRSTPIAVGGFVTVSFGKNEVLKLLHVNVGPGQTGGLTIKGQALVGTDYDLRWYDASFTKGVLDDHASLLEVRGSGRAVMEVFAGAQQSYALAVSRPPGEISGATTIQIGVRLALPDLTWTTPTGWYGPLVPRRAPDTFILSVPAPTSLTGYTNGTYFNFAVLNDSPTPAGAYALDLNVDGARIWSANFGAIGGNATNHVNNWGPLSVAGGRHTFSMTMDSLDAVEESDEENGIYGEQWIWSPLELLQNDWTTRTQPLAPTAGWDHIKGGVGTWYNCDGYFMDEYGSTCQALAAIPSSGNNVDLRLHEPSTGAQDGFASTLVASSWGPGSSDFVLAHFENIAPQGFDVGVISQGAVGGQYTVHAVAGLGLGVDPVGEFGVYPLVEDEILRLFEMRLGAGRWGFEVVAGPGDDIDWGLSVHELDLDMAYLSKSTVESNRIAWLQPQGAGEFVSFDTMQPSSFCVAVWKVGAADLPNAGSFSLRIHDLTTVDVPDAVPARFALQANVPNPFNPATSIYFDLPRPETVTLQVFDAAGRRIRTLLAARQFPGGRHQIVWDGRGDRGRGVASGAYFARLTAGHDTAVRKMTLLK